MTTSSRISLSANFSDEREKLLRAVWADKYPHLWDTKNNRPSSAAFKDKNGLSVDRAGQRTDAEAVEYAKNHLHGFIVAATVEMCRKANVSPKYLPSKTTPYHSELHGSETTKPFSPMQALTLARNVIILYCPEENSMQFSINPST